MFNVASPAIGHNPTLYDIKPPPLNLSHDGSPEHPYPLWLPWQPALSNQLVYLLKGLKIFLP